MIWLRAEIAIHLGHCMCDFIHIYTVRNLFIPLAGFVPTMQVRENLFRHRHVLLLKVHRDIKSE